MEDAHYLTIGVSPLNLPKLNQEVNDSLRGIRVTILSCPEGLNPSWMDGKASLLKATTEARRLMRVH